jgi:molybdenum cofactor cytidylyltransferase
MTVAAVLLAAGDSNRFGPADKLAAPLNGLPLRLHAARSLADLPFAARFVVTAPGLRDWPGFKVIGNDRSGDGMAHSIRLGLDAVRLVGATAMLIVLADMPCVPADHYRRPLDRHRGPGSLVASSDGRRRTPPALFGSDWFPQIERISGDRGARALLDQAELVVTDSRNLLDIDTPADILAARSDRSAEA